MQVVAVAARDVSNATAFAERFGIPKAYGSYAELAKDENVGMKHFLFKFFNFMCFFVIFPQIVEGWRHHPPPSRQPQRTENPGSAPDLPVINYQHKLLHVKSYQMSCKCKKVGPLNIATNPFISDIVYIGNIHPFHCETTKLMLNNGKNVLCEKPLAMNYKEVKEMIDLAKEKGLFLAEVIYETIILFHYA